MASFDYLILNFAPCVRWVGYNFFQLDLSICSASYSRYSFSCWWHYHPTPLTFQHLQFGSLDIRSKFCSKQWHLFPKSGHAECIVSERLANLIMCRNLIPVCWIHPSIHCNLEVNLLFSMVEKRNNEVLDGKSDYHRLTDWYRGPMKGMAVACWDWVCRHDLVHTSMFSNQTSKSQQCPSWQTTREFLSITDTWACLH